MSAFQNTCVVCVGKKRRVMDWRDAVGLAWRIYILDSMLEILCNPLPLLEEDLKTIL